MLEMRILACFLWLMLVFGLGLTAGIFVCALMGTKKESNEMGLTSLLSMEEGKEQQLTNQFMVLNKSLETLDSQL